jgi:hypothetical protein
LAIPDLKGCSIFKGAGGMPWMRALRLPDFNGRRNAGVIFRG